jgi:hypothetical protein
MAMAQKVMNQMALSGMPVFLSMVCQNWWPGTAPSRLKA